MVVTYGRRKHEYPPPSPSNLSATIAPISFAVQGYRSFFISTSDMVRFGLSAYVDTSTLVRISLYNQDFLRRN